MPMLEFTKQCALPQDTSAFLVEDGTIFYRTRFPPDRLYVNRNGVEIVAQLPGDCAFTAGAHGNDIYFETDRKIYKAVLSPPNAITVSYLRDQLEDEEIHPGAICSRIEDGVIYVYRLGDDPINDAMYIDTSSDDLYGANLIAIQEGSAIFEIRNANCHRPSARRLKDNVLRYRQDVLRHM
ncbi:hypothetical protein PMAYCL1PPCAC_09349 [Pristionchus mayeri]|uniref:Uncharacterized protein n=1 Tax=Pristionchus mayeri TaxID=1317129 RepID=A0AAN5CDW9_9BILA|nr:hypothetical protein PMAYCL1PPCAC_09349 [Pristionchus mayeri]